MEANSKLQRKKRIAHSHMSKSNLDGPKLSLDDFVYKIMNDMDSNNIMSSYELSQDSKSKRRQETSKKNGQYTKNSNPDSYCKKLERKFVPKRSFPLMQKCQTSLKYLNKNRCIPKPRAHVGSIPKPPKQSADFPGPGISNSMTENTTNSVRRTEVQSKAYSQVIESNLIRDSNIKIQQNKTTEKEDMITQDNDRMTQDNDSSNSDEDDAAYENFIKRTKEESKISSDSDSDSHLTILRKKTKSTRKRKQFKKQSTKCISKVTSVPLPDSSDSQSEEALEANERLKHREVSTKNRTQVPAKFVEFQSDSSLDDLPDINTNYSSSEEDTSVGSTAKENTEPTVDFIDKLMPAIENSTDIGSSFKLSSKATHQQGDQNLALIYDSISRFPCCVRLKRDPIIEQKVKTYISSLNYSTVDCINVSDESEAESSTLLSKDDSPFSSNSQHKGTSVQSFDSGNFQELDDCIIMCELPKGASTSRQQPPASRGITSTSTEINCEQSCNSDEPADATPVSGAFRTIEEFKVQIVAVQSVIEKSENSTIVKAEEENDVEVIDLSDDEVISQQNNYASNNSEVVRQLDAEPNTTEKIQHDITDYHFIPNDQNQGSQMLLSNPIDQSHCQESPVQVQKISNSKILDVLNKIDFNSIKEILSKINSNQSEASIAGKTLMSNEEQHTSKGSPLPDSTNKNFSKPNAAIQGINCTITSACVVSSDPAIDLRSSPNPFKHISVVSAGETNRLNAELNNKIYTGEGNLPATLNFENSPMDIPFTQKQIAAVCDNFNCSNIKTYIQKQIKDSEMEDIGENKNLSCTINIKKRKDPAICRPVIKRPKYDMFENSLDVIAASFTEDLGSPNKKVDALRDLYEEEYAKYINIVNTEANVTQGLRLLRDKQREKLTYLHSSIKSVEKHDPCYLTAVQEKFQSKALASIKSEEKLKPQSLIPPGSSVNYDIPVHAKTNIEVIDGKPSGSEIPVYHPKLEGKLTSSERQQEVGTLAQSEVKVKHSVMTTDRGRLLEYLRSLKCDECGKPAAVSCQGCAQAFYCSPQCAAISWKKRHKVACRRRI